MVVVVGGASQVPGKAPSRRRLAGVRPGKFPGKYGVGAGDTVGGSQEAASRRRLGWRFPEIRRQAASGESPTKPHWGYDRFSYRPG